MMISNFYEYVNAYRNTTVPYLHLYLNYSESYIEIFKNGQWNTNIPDFPMDFSAKPGFNFLIHFSTVTIGTKLLVCGGSLGVNSRLLVTVPTDKVWSISSG